MLSFLERCARLTSESTVHAIESTCVDSLTNTPRHSTPRRVAHFVSLDFCMLASAYYDGMFAADFPDGMFAVIDSCA